MSDTYLRSTRGQSGNARTQSSPPDALAVDLVLRTQLLLARQLLKPMKGDHVAQVVHALKAQFRHVLRAAPKSPVREPHSD